MKFLFKPLQSWRVPWDGAAPWMRVFRDVPRAHPSSGGILEGMWDGGVEPRRVSAAEWGF